MLSQVNQNVPRAFLRVAIPTAVLVLEELCVRTNPFRAQPQDITGTHSGRGGVKKHSKYSAGMREDRNTVTGTGTIA